MATTTVHPSAQEPGALTSRPTPPVPVVVAPVIHSHEGRDQSVASHLEAYRGRWASEEGHPLAEWLRTKNLRAKTARSYARTALAYCVWLKEVRGVDDPLWATYADMLAYRDHLRARGYASATQRAYLDTLSSMYSFWLARDYVRVHPMHGLARPKLVDARVKRAWTREEFTLFMHAIRTERAQAEERGASAWRRSLYARDVALFALLFRNGLRVSEVCGARVGDLTTKPTRGGVVDVLEITEEGAHHPEGDQHVKGGASRDAVLKRETAEALRQYLAARAALSGAPLLPSAPLFARGHASGRKRRDGTQGDTLAPSTVWRLMRHYGGEEGAKLDPAILYPHEGRHTLITTLVLQGEPLPKVRSVSGHKSDAILRYVHDDADLGASAALRVPY